MSSIAEPCQFFLHNFIQFRGKKFLLTKISSLFYLNFNSPNLRIYISGESECQIQKTAFSIYPNPLPTEVLLSDLFCSDDSSLTSFFSYAISFLERTLIDVSKSRRTFTEQ